MSNKIKKCKQLGMDAGTAAHILRKSILFSFAQRLGEDNCYKCGTKVETIGEFSIEHKIPWLDSSVPKELFFDLNNIAFSHLVCNIGSGRKPHQKYFTTEDKIEANRQLSKARMRKAYTTDKRKIKYERTGY